MQLAEDPHAGNPFDRRPEATRLRFAASVFGDFEYMAARVIARYLGERVELVDDGSSDSLVDIRITYDSGAVGSVEVVMDADGKWAGAYEMIRRREFRLAAPDLARRWCLYLSRRCDLRQLDARAHGLLVSLETSGPVVEPFTDLDRLRVIGSRTVKELLSIGVIGLSSRPLVASDERYIQLVPEGSGGAPEEDWDGFHEALSRLLSSDALADVRTKLAATHEPERHVFIGLTMSSDWSLDFWLGDDHDDIPGRPPELPEAITHLWLWGRSPISRVLAWFPDRGWFDPSADWATA